MWNLFYLINIAPRFFPLDCSSFSRNNVWKTLSFLSGIFFSLSLNNNKKKHYYFDEQQTGKQQTGRTVKFVSQRNIVYSGRNLGTDCLHGLL